MQIDLDKRVQVTFKNDSLVKPKNNTLDINAGITELEFIKAYKYLGINEANGISSTVNKEEIRK